MAHATTCDGSCGRCPGDCGGSICTCTCSFETRGDAQRAAIERAKTKEE